MSISRGYPLGFLASCVPDNTMTVNYEQARHWLGHRSEESQKGFPDAQRAVVLYSSLLVSDNLRGFYKLCVVLTGSP